MIYFSGQIPACQGPGVHAWERSVHATARHTAPEVGSPVLPHRSCVEGQKRGNGAARGADTAGRALLHGASGLHKMADGTHLMPGGRGRGGSREGRMCLASTAGP